MEFRTFRFTGPSGFEYEIREQNGADEDILSNLSDMKTLMNLTKFIAAIVIRTTATPNGKLTVDDALNLPVNDRYAIIFNSRIFSLGEEVEFEYDWGKENGGKITYGQDLHEFLFDYGTHTLEEKGREPQYDGYVESFTEDWKQLDNYDNNASKTMNAHLHVLEAYTLLYQCWKDDGLRKRLKFCAELFMDRIYDSSRRHFNLFFDNAWNSLVEMDSYGHDVEAGWLLCEAARVLEDRQLMDRANRLALDVTDACLVEGLSDKG